MTWIRLIVYTGTSEWIAEQRSRSLPEGTRKFNGPFGAQAVTARTLYGTGFWARIREIVRILRTTE